VFDQLTGTISGWTDIEGVRDMPYIIRAYNERGVGLDTVYFSFLLDTVTRVSVPGPAGSASTYLGLQNYHSRTSIIYSVASPENTAAIYFILYNCRGTVVWREKIPNNVIVSGRRSLAITGRLPPGSYYLEMKTIDRKGGNNAAATIPAVIVP
jgi:hypothetical protein